MRDPEIGGRDPIAVEVEPERSTGGVRAGAPSTSRFAMDRTK